MFWGSEMIDSNPLSQTGSAGHSGAGWRPEEVTAMMTVAFQNEQTNHSDGRTADLKTNI